MSYSETHFYSNNVVYHQGFGAISRCTTWRLSPTQSFSLIFTFRRLQGVMHSVLTSRVILHLHIATAGDEASARSISLPAFASPENGNATTMTTSLEQDAVGSPSYPSYPSSAPPLLSLGSLSVDFDIGIEFLEEGGSTSRVLFTAEA